jgi:hypothetical protein
MDQALLDVKNSLDDAIESIIVPSLDVDFVFLGSEIEETKVLGPYIKAELKNNRANRNISISYLPGNSQKAEVLIFHVSNERNGTFNVPEYLSHVGVKFEENSFKISTHAGSLRTRIESVLKINNSAIHTHLAKILSGKEWVDIPFDWGDNK